MMRYKLPAVTNETGNLAGETMGAAADFVWSLDTWDARCMLRPCGSCMTH